MNEYPFFVFFLSASSVDCEPNNNIRREAILHERGSAQNTQARKKVGARRTNHENCLIVTSSLLGRKSLLLRPAIWDHLLKLFRGVRPKWRQQKKNPPPVNLSIFRCFFLFLFFFLSTLWQFNCFTCIKSSEQKEKKISYLKILYYRKIGAVLKLDNVFLQFPVGLTRAREWITKRSRNNHKSCSWKGWARERKQLTMHQTGASAEQLAHKRIYKGKTTDGKRKKKVAPSSYIYDEERASSGIDGTSVRVDNESLMVQMIPMRHCQRHYPQVYISIFFFVFYTENNFSSLQKRKREDSTNTHTHTWAIKVHAQVSCPTWARGDSRNLEGGHHCDLIGRNTRVKHLRRAPRLLLYIFSLSQDV